MVSVTEIKRKLCLIGDWATGKTSLIRKYVLDQFDDRYLVTVGTKVYKKRINFKKDESNIFDFNFIIWDILGQKEFKRVQSLAYMGTHAAFIVCDITRRDTLTSVSRWREELFDVTKEIPIIILANKIDLQYQAQFTEEDLKLVASQLQAPYLFTSAKTGINVEKAFLEIGRRLI